MQLAIYRLDSHIGTLWIGLLWVLSASGIMIESVQAMPPIELAPIQYGKKEVSDPVAQLQRKLDAGKIQLAYEEEHGYLKSVLKHLGVPVSSQMLVFSKTSFQRYRISPQTPRAIYFSDDAYVGWVQEGDVVELSAVDPQQGAIFYSLSQTESDHPKFTRHTHRCTLCHAGSQTGYVPGHLVRSVYSDSRGYPVLGSGTFRTDHTSPLKQRWGGWYVTGKHGSQRHMGNVQVKKNVRPEKFTFDKGANVTDLSSYFSTAPYLASGSDIVALMVLEHQGGMLNRITRANYDARLMLREQRVLNESLERPADFRSPSIERRLDRAALRVVEHLLLSDEAQLTDLIQGTSGFTEEFARQSPRDPQGRSLRDFDLRRRLFRYPCSYLIYSAAFDAIPAPVLDRIYRQLWEVLAGKNQDKMFAHLSGTDRRVILEILQATKRGLPDYWK